MQFMKRVHIQQVQNLLLILKVSLYVNNLITYGHFSFILFKLVITYDHNNSVWTLNFEILFCILEIISMSFCKTVCNLEFEVLFCFLEISFIYFCKKQCVMDYTLLLWSGQFYESHCYCETYYWWITFKPWDRPRAWWYKRFAWWNTHLGAC